MSIISRFFLAAATSVALLLGACASDEALPYVERSPEAIYSDAKDALDAGNYQRAVQLFDEVERQHPYSIWARRAILMGAYAAYLDNEYIQAIGAAQRFLQLYPGNKDAPYALYLVGISYYEQIVDVGRDQATTRDAQRFLNELINRYPNTEYAKDARIKIDLTNDHLAGKEMEIGRYYLQRRHYVGAINRFRNVIERYQTTSHVPEALHRLVEAYLALGVAYEAQTAAAVLGHNFPGSPWYADSYFLLEGVDLRPEVDERSWLARFWDRLFF